MCHAYCFGSNAGWKKLSFQLALNNNFCPPDNPSPTDDLNIAKEQKLTKQCFLPPSHQFYTQSSQYQNFKNKISTPF